MTTMKVRVVSGLFLLWAMMGLAQTNVLQLVWAQPPGYSSTLYTATNLGGTWSVLSTNSPPLSVTATQQVAFFYVVVTPTNTNPQQVFSGNYHGGVPDITPVAAVALTVDTSNGNLWSWYSNAWH